MRTTGLSHLALNTADLDRFRRFYEGQLGLRVGVVLRMNHPPHLRHATFHIDDIVVLHVFEVPGYDPQAKGIGATMGDRGRIDHFGFMVRDEVELRTVADRLRASGATDGQIRRLGPVLSVHVTDPDGLEVEINCPDLEFDLVDGAGEEIEEIGVPDWLERMRSAVLVAPTSPP